MTTKPNTTMTSNAQLGVVPSGDILQVNARGYPANDWKVITGEMVACPGCAFTFGAEHVTHATGQYDCPVCKAWSYDGVPS